MAEQYVVRFDLNGPGNGVALIDSVAARVVDWVNRDFAHANLPIAAGEFEHSDSRVRIEAGEVNEAKFWRLDWRHPDRTGKPFTWSSRISLGTLGDAAELTVDVRVAAAGTGLSHEVAQVDRPRLVREVVGEYDCTFEGHPLSAAPLFVNSEKDNAETFIRAVLLSSDRRLPLVVVTAGPDGAPVVDAERMASRLAALATVAVFDFDAAWKLTEIVGRELTCFNGSVRTYWPDVEPYQDPHAHPLWLPEKSRRVAGSLDRFLLSQFAPRVARHVQSPRTFHKAREKIRELQRGALFSDLRASKENEAVFAEMIGEVQAQHEDLVKARDSLEYRVLELEVERDALREELEAQRTQWAQVVDYGKASSAPVQVDIDSVLKATQTADQNLPAIRFLPSAFESARESPYRDPKAVYDAFEALQECATERTEGVLGRSIADWLSDRSVDYAAHLSSTTRGKWGDDYPFMDPKTGQKRLMEPHLRFGADGDPVNCLRVHLDWDDTEGRWIIGHVGRHLTNTRS